MQAGEKESRSCCKESRVGHGKEPGHFSRLTMVPRTVYEAHVAWQVSCCTWWDCNESRALLASHDKDKTLFRQLVCRVIDTVYGNVQCKSLEFKLACFDLVFCFLRQIHSILFTFTRQHVTHRDRMWLIETARDSSRQHVTHRDSAVPIMECTDM